MTSLHVICGLPPPQSKILATPMPLSARGPTQYKSGPGITCLVSVTIYRIIFQ